MESPLARIIERLGSTKAEMAQQLGVSEALIDDICEGISVGERAYRALIARLELKVELEHLIQVQKEFCAAKQLEQIERLRKGSDHNK